jgi:hypothetical protein
MSKIERAQQRLFRFITRPLTGSIGFLLVVTIILLVPQNGPSLMALSLVGPLLIIPVAALNMNFIAMVFRRFTLSESMKRNHALEHGTIFMLRSRYGKKTKMGGNAEIDGFRIYGVDKKEHIEKAFDFLVTELKRGNSELIISMRCGTNVGTAQGLGIVLLSLSAMVLLLVNANATVSLTVLGIDVILYFLLRTSLGNWVQGKFYMSLDFAGARIQSIYSVKTERIWEKGPVYFVKTEICH